MQKYDTALLSLISSAVDCVEEMRAEGVDFFKFQVPLG